MSIALVAPAALVAVLMLLLCLAAAEDAWRLRISNPIVAAVALSGVAAIAFAGIGWSTWQPVALAVAILAIGTAMYGAGWVGGGDVKLWAAGALWFGLAEGARMIVAVALAGGVLTIAILLIRLLPWSERAKAKVVIIRPRGGIPYGIAIAMGIAATIMVERASEARVSAIPSTRLAIPH